MIPIMILYLRALDNLSSNQMEQKQLFWNH